MKSSSSYQGDQLSQTSLAPLFIWWTRRTVRSKRNMTFIPHPYDSGNIDMWNIDMKKSMKNVIWTLFVPLSISNSFLLRFFQWLQVTMISDRLPSVGNSHSQTVPARPSGWWNRVIFHIAILLCWKMEWNGIHYPSPPPKCPTWRSTREKGQESNNTALWRDPLPSGCECAVFAWTGLGLWRSNPPCAKDSWQTTRPKGAWKSVAWSLLWLAGALGLEA